VLFTFLPVLTAAMYVRVDRRPETQHLRSEVLMVQLLAFTGGSGISGFFAHTFFADSTAETIGWPEGNPFQHEVAFANLALGVLGLVAVHRDDGFRDATVVAVTVFALGATLTHVVDIIENVNFAPGNTIQNIANLVRPTLLVLTLRATRRVDARAAASAWHSTVGKAALWAMATAATGFGLGYSIGAAPLGAAIGAICALMIIRQVALAASARA